MTSLAKCLSAPLRRSKNIHSCVKPSLLSYSFITALMFPEPILTAKIIKNLNYLNIFLCLNKSQKNL